MGKEEKLVQENCWAVPAGFGGVSEGRRKNPTQSGGEEGGGGADCEKEA